MAKIMLKRFKDLTTYNECKDNGSIKDGDLFIIDETRQIGTDVKGKFILTPSNTLYDYTLPEGEIVITSNDTISRAIAKLEYRVKAAKTLAQTAIDTIGTLEDLENVTDAEAAIIAKIEELENEIDNLPKHVALSELAYQSLESIDNDTVYYIYEND